MTSVDTNYTFTGREDDGNGLMYYRNRYYSPSMKRFISEDPIGLNGGINQYAYVEGNLLALNDPSGTALNPIRDKGALDEVLNYDSQYIQFIKVLERIEFSPIIFTVIARRVNDELLKYPQFPINEYNGDIYTIVWNPHAAIACDNGQKDSPAIALGHEIEHVFVHLTAPKNYAAREDSGYANKEHDLQIWQNPEKQYNINGLEHRLANYLGKGIRTSRNGYHYSVSWVTKR